MRAQSKGWLLDMSTRSGYCPEPCAGVFAVAAPAPDGATIAVAWTREVTGNGNWADPFDGLHLTLLDATNGAVLDQIKVPTLFPLWITDEAVPVWIDFNGTKAIVGLRTWDRQQTTLLDNTTPLLVDTLARTIEVLPGPTGHATFWTDQNT